MTKSNKIKIKRNPPKPKTPRKKVSSSSTVEGRLEITKGGRGFVIVNGMDQDVLIRPENLKSAIDGDIVKVHIYAVNEKDNPLGEIIDVVQRKRNEFIGFVQMSKGFAFITNPSGKRMPDIYVPAEHFNNAKDGDKVVINVTDWGKDGKKPSGIITQILNDVAESDLVMKELLMDKGFPLEFSKEVLQETAQLPLTISEEEMAKRKDVRNVLTFTIDPADAKDFDDAISFRKLKNGNYEIGVHIADVSHYVTPDTALDKEAYLKATSVYLPDRVNPMLPEEISNILCSLRPHEDKLAFSVIFQINEQAEVKQYWAGRTIIHSDRRYAYEEVQEIIETQKGDYVEEILTVNKLSQTLRKQRFDNGAINFNSTEVRFKLDENGTPIGIELKVSKESHQLIEELMLLANKVIAKHVAKVKINGKPIPFPYRIHDTPDEEKLLPFIAFANKFGYKFDASSPDAIAMSFNRLVKDVQGKPEEPVLQQLGIRTMAKAKYTSENVGHYGLGFEYYCHFTSPIRRYPDIMVHRILHQVLENTIVIDKNLEEKCVHCSERERAAMEIERDANKYKQVQYMLPLLGDEFYAVVSGVSQFGFWAETVEQMCEGMVPISSLAHFDDFKHSASDFALIGQRTGKKFVMGDKVKVKLVAANLDKRQIDFEWIEE